MLDIVVLFMRVTNSTWPADDIVDVFPIDKDPGPGVPINEKHAVLVIRNIPVVDQPSTFAKIKALLTQINYLDDADPSKGTFDKRRWFFKTIDLTGSQQAALTNDGYLDIDWADISLVTTRKVQGATPVRVIGVGDLS